MRAHTVVHTVSKFIENYDLRDGAELIGGTVPGLGRHDLRNRFDRLSNGTGFLHITLSLPEGIKASRAQWLMVAAFQLQLMGIDPTRTGWIAVRHTDSRCDHIHIALSRRAFSGVIVSPRLSALQTERNHVRMAARLGLDRPVYFDPAVPTLTPPVPARRLRDPRAAKLATDLEQAIRRHWPCNLDELDACLAHCEPPVLRHVSQNRHGRASWSFEQGGFTWRGGALGPAFEPRHIRARLALCKALDRTRLALDLEQLLSAVAPYSAKLKGLSDAHHHRNADLAQGSRDPAVSAATDGWESGPAPAAPRSPAGRNRGAVGTGRGAPQCVASDPEGAQRIPDPASGSGEAHGFPDRSADRARGRTPQDRGDDRRDARPSDGTGRRLSWGHWLGHLLRHLRRDFSGWHWHRVSGQRIRVCFGDRSEVLCVPGEITQNIPGNDAQAFRESVSPGALEHTPFPETPSPGP